MMYILLAISVLLIVATVYEMLQIKLLWETTSVKRKREKSIEQLAYAHNECLLKMMDDVDELKRMTLDMKEYNKIIRRLP